MQWDSAVVSGQLDLHCISSIAASMSYIDVSTSYTIVWHCRPFTKKSRGLLHSPKPFLPHWGGGGACNIVISSVQKRGH